MNSKTVLIVALIAVLLISCSVEGAFLKKIVSKVKSTVKKVGDNKLVKHVAKVGGSIVKNTPHGKFFGGLYGKAKKFVKDPRQHLQNFYHKNLKHKLHGSIKSIGQGFAQGGFQGAKYRAMNEVKGYKHQGMQAVNQGQQLAQQFASHGRQMATDLVNKAPQMADQMMQEGPGFQEDDEEEDEEDAEDEEEYEDEEDEEEDEEDDEEY